MQARLGTLPVSDPNDEPRIPIWARVLPLTTQFPVCGTGFGTFEHVEPLSRGPSDFVGVPYGHAHNEYLQTVIEGGWVALALGLGAVFLVFRNGWRALQGSPQSAALALGALFAFSTLVVHSAVDYGLHMPAIVFLATVLCAQLSGLADLPASEAANVSTFRLGDWAPVFGAAAAVAVALVLFREGWRAPRKPSAADWPP